VVTTTDDEREAFFVVRAIPREAVEVKRIALRDQQSYCGILLDDNNRKPIARLYFNGSKKAVGLSTMSSAKRSGWPSLTSKASTSSRQGSRLLWRTTPATRMALLSASSLSQEYVAPLVTKAPGRAANCPGVVISA
jgi:hypothetical protein